MGDRIVCSKCAVISRGFTGDCKHVVERVEAERERCAKVVDEEPELSGPIPDEVRQGLQKTLLEDGLEGLMRFCVRVTKKCIGKRIRAGE